MSEIYDIIIFLLWRSKLIYTNQKSKLSKKQLQKREALLKQQRAIRKELKLSKMYGRRVIEYMPPIFDTKHIPSRDSGIGNTAKKQSNTYSGNAIIGLGTLHKSNCVPIFSDQEAKEIAQMRR